MKNLNKNVNKQKNYLKHQKENNLFYKVNQKKKKLYQNKKLFIYKN